MCGIAGFTVFTDRYTASCHIQRMVGSLVHRGIDSQGIYIDEHVALGARRLSIMDVDNGDQPYYNESSKIVAVFNGEIYNDKEIRTKLIAKGHTLTSTCDGELIPHLYEEYGSEFVAKLDGMFSIALWDKRTQELLLAGDPMGIKPLYYTHLSDGNLAFSSELKSLFVLRASNAELDPVSIGEYLRFKSIPSPYTPFRGIFKLRQGERLIWRQGQSHHSLYTSDVAHSESELGALLFEQIRSTMRSDVPVACILSGGLDSSFVLRGMTEFSDVPVTTFSVGYPGSLQDDETVYAARIAKELGAEFHRVTVSPHDIVDLLDRVIWHLDEPNQDPITIPYFAIMQRVREEFKVVLTGDGADEGFGGYSRYRFWDQPDQQQALNHYRKELLLFDDPDLFALLRSDRWEEMLVEREAAQSLKNVTNLREAMLWETQYRLPSYHLLRVDKLAMAWGVEARVPYLRPKVVKAASRLAVSELRQEGIEKYALRHAVSPHLPEWLMNRVKKPFTFPISNWLKEELRDWVGDMLLSADSNIHEWVDSQRIQQLWKEHLSSKRDHTHRLWGLLVLSQFLYQNH